MSAALKRERCLMKVVNWCHGGIRAVHVSSLSDNCFCPKIMINMLQWKTRDLKKYKKNSLNNFLVKHNKPSCPFPRPLPHYRLGKWTSGNSRTNVEHVAWCGQILVWHEPEVQSLGMHTETTHWSWTSKWALADFITLLNARHLPTYGNVSAYTVHVLCEKAMLDFQVSIPVPSLVIVLAVYLE